MTNLHLVRDVLDKQLLDRNNFQMGRVDGLVLEVPENGPPRLVRIELGGPVLAARLASWIVGPVRALARLWGPKRLTPVKIPWANVVQLGRDVHVDIDARETKALAWEKWLQRNLIDRLPGA